MRLNAFPGSARAFIRAVKRCALQFWPHVIIYVYVLYAGALVYQYINNTIDEPADFTVFFSAGLLSAAGRVSDAYTLAGIDEIVKELFPGTQKRFYWFYPPYYHLLLEIFAQFGYNVAFLLWNAVMLTWMAVTLRPLVDRHSAPVIAAFPPLLIKFALGQNGFLVAGLLAVLCVHADRRPVVAGLALGVLSFKPHLGLLLPLALVLRGRLKTILIAFAVVVVLCALGYLRYGLEAWSAFLEAAGKTADLVQERKLRVDLMVSPLATMSNLGFGMPTATFVQYLVSSSVVASFVVAGFRAAPLRLLLGLAVAGTFVASPYSFPYDWCAIVVPLALLFQDSRGRGWIRGDRPTIALLYVAGFAASFAWQGWTYPLPALSLLMFYIVYWRRVWTFGWRDGLVSQLRRRRRP